MRASFLIQEAVRNALTGTARAGAMFAVAIVATGAVLAADIATIGGIDARAREYRASAAAIRILVADSAVSPAACDRLGELPGFTGAGAVTPLDPVQLPALGALSIPHYEVTDGVADLLGIPVTGEAGVYLSDALAETWGVDAGATLALSQAEVAVLDTFAYPEEDGRDPRLASAIVTIGTPETASECWAEVWPTDPSRDAVLRSALIPGAAAAKDARTTSANPARGPGFDGQREFADRPTRFAVASLGLVFAVVAAAGTRRRRLELASNLHAGARHRDLVAITVAETVFWAVPAGLLAMAASGWATHLLLGRDEGIGSSPYAATIAIAVVSAILGALVPVVPLRESTLFQRFKERA
ncbi:hypothetical protein [Microbacterium sp. No. 7]|uniref:hypothetical protein n=1 Tax=Microbacterium sp. No. 7 TaxID=1714373 RepID=UPI0006D1A9CD|nr:hypothetical protein [Microbacterium sp. No. 7]ALJ20521.1 hypothetical protein AOA12_11645 [Microbacterium sp. No. 7]